MILTHEELKKLKWLIPYGNGKFYFTGKGKATSDEVAVLLQFDRDNYDLFGGHLIENFDELENSK